MGRDLRRELLLMVAEDLRMREELAENGSLYGAYHPRMQQVHQRNAARLLEILDEHGWPGRSLVGDDGAEAAWLIVQHAMSPLPIEDPRHVDERRREVGLEPLSEDTRRRRDAVTNSAERPPPDWAAYRTRWSSGAVQSDGGAEAND